MKIIYETKEYPIIRLIFRKVKNFHYFKAINPFRLFFLFYRLFEKTFRVKLINLLDSGLLKYSFFGFSNSENKIYHLYNSVNYGRGKWVVTYETLLPRYNKFLQNKSISKDLISELVLGRLASDKCVAILALSNNAKQIQMKLLKGHKHYEVITSKISVLHPPQKLVIKEYSEKPNNKVTKFIFVGRDFFRKGGMEVLNAFTRLRNLGVKNFELTIVSSLDYGDYASKSSHSDQLHAINVINEHCWIKWYESLDNSAVLDLLKNHDIGLLPTYADTYGFSVLEMLASGCPCITTDVRALSEVNLKSHGWIINVPKDRYGEGQYLEQGFSQSIEEGIFNYIRKLVDSKSEIETKGRAALDYIKNNHSEAEYCSKLESIYSRELN